MKIVSSTDNFGFAVEGKEVLNRGKSRKFLVC